MHLQVPNEFAHEKSYFYDVKTEHYEKRRREKLKLAIQVSDLKVLA